MPPKPNSCRGCPLETKGYSFVQPSGPWGADLCIVGEAPGEQEARHGEPFYPQAPAGGKLQQLLRKVGLDRDKARIGNIVSCRPPENELRGKPWERGAITQCQENLQPILREGHKVTIAAGALAARTLLEQSHKNFKLDHWHGCLVELGNGAILKVVSTYHPSHLLQGGQKLTGVALFDLMIAKRVLEGTFTRRPAQLIQDPSLEWFKAWVDELLQKADAGLDVWTTVDIETEEKLSGKEEDKLEGSNIRIVRVNFACDSDIGITVPWLGYQEQIRRLLEHPRLKKLFWNWRYDIPILRQEGFPVVHPWHDGMHMAKVLQSDLPLSLGFWAPFYSGGYGAWKHLSDSDPAKYAAIDGFMTLRIGLGLQKDLIKAGQWDIYQRHIYELDRLVLHPAEEVGLNIDSPGLEVFRDSLLEKEAQLQSKIQSQVDEDSRPLIGNWKKPKAGMECIERLVEKEALVCTDCGAQDVTVKHKCKKAPSAKAPKTPKTPRKSRKEKSKTSEPETQPDDSSSLLGLSTGDDPTGATSGKEGLGDRG